MHNISIRNTVCVVVYHNDSRVNNKGWVVRKSILCLFSMETSSLNSILQWTGWQTSDGNLMEKSDEKPPLNKFQLYVYLSLFYIQISAIQITIFGNIWSTIFQRNKNVTPVRLRSSTSRSVVRCFIHCIMESIDVTSKWFQYNAKQQEVTGAAIYFCQIFMECHQTIRFFMKTKVYA